MRPNVKRARMLDHLGSSRSYPKKEPLRARFATIHHRSHLGAVLRPITTTGSETPLGFSPTAHRRQVGLRQTRAGTRFRLRLREDLRCVMFGDYYLLRRRRDEWIGSGVMEKLQEITLDAYDRIVGLELSDVAVDCCITKAPCGGEKRSEEH